MPKLDYLAIAAIVFAAWNLIVFLVYGIDKLKAKKEKWRIPEKTLLLMALCLGGTGALIGMGVFHHKTQHKSFSIGVPLMTLLNYVIIGGALWLIYRK